MDPETEEKLLAQSLIAAAARHDDAAVRNLLRNNVSANVQDDETGYTPLHAAIAGCAPPSSEAPSATVPSPLKNGKFDGSLDDVEGKVASIVRMLFENGAIWNDIDVNDETPACIAWRLGLKQVYEIIVEAGIRAEILLNRLSELENGTQSDDNSESEEYEGQERRSIDSSKSNGPDPNQSSQVQKNPEQPPSTSQKGATNIEVANSEKSLETEPPTDYIDHWDSNAAFLRSSLRFTPTQLLDSSSNAVMMDWETALMKRHAQLLLPGSGLRALNIGHGMGIVDTAIQAHAPSTHHIVEAHPAVLARMRETGWFEKAGVRVHEGRWQEVLPKLVEEGVEVDAIYYDTFAEDYKDFKDLFSEHVIGLLDSNGKFGFYNGLGADRRVCYDVYKGVAEIDLSEAGFKTEWEDLAVPEIEWKGVRRPYWNVDVYRLPTCSYL